MSKESDYIINQINQAPKDFKGDESDFIIDKMKIEWDNPDIEKLDKHFSKVNKLYGAMDTTELPFMLIQDLYNKSGRDLKRSMKALERINSQIEKDPDFDKYGGGDYLTRWYELTENPYEESLPMDNQMMPEDFR
tara:strand:+ start:283 stop:687 length:405 start_codon:yes stop_codon:yes gene_type:complete